MVEESENADHVIVIDWLLERLQESLQTTVSHRQIVDLATEDKLVVDSSDCCRLEVMSWEERRYGRVVEITVHIKNRISRDAGFLAD